MTPRFYVYCFHQTNISDLLSYFLEQFKNFFEKYLLSAYFNNIPYQRGDTQPENQRNKLLNLKLMVNNFENFEELAKGKQQRRLEMEFTVDPLV